MISDGRRNVESSIPLVRLTTGVESVARRRIVRASIANRPLEWRNPKVGVPDRGFGLGRQLNCIRNRHAQQITHILALPESLRIFAAHTPQANKWFGLQDNNTAVAVPQPPSPRTAIVVGMSHPSRNCLSVTGCRAGAVAASRQ